MAGQHRTPKITMPRLGRVQADPRHGMNADRQGDAYRPTPSSEPERYRGKRRAPERPRGYEGRRRADELVWYPTREQWEILASGGSVRGMQLRRARRA